MHHVVIVSNRDLKIGERYVHPVSGPDRICREMGFVVIAEVTEVEYRECLREYNVPDDWPFFEPVRFFKILTD